MPEEQWLRTPQAAIVCGVSERTLKRLRGDVLEEGIHYQVGFSSNSAITWEVNGVRAKLAWRGMIQRKASEVIRANRSGHKNEPHTICVALTPG